MLVEGSLRLSLRWCSCQCPALNRSSIRRTMWAGSRRVQCGRNTNVQHLPCAPTPLGIFRQLSDLLSRLIQRPRQHQHRNSWHREGDRERVKVLHLEASGRASPSRLFKATLFKTQRYRSSVDRRERQNYFASASFHARRLSDESFRLVARNLGSGTGLAFSS